MTTKTEPQWWALRVNGKVEGVYESAEAAIESFDGSAHYMADGKDLKKGPIVFDLVPVDITEK